MKAKIISIPIAVSTAIDYPFICFQEVQICAKSSRYFWDHSCYGLCLEGVLDDRSNWHGPTITDGSKKRVNAFQKKAWAEGFVFSHLETCSQEVTRRWNGGEERPEVSKIYHIPGRVYSSDFRHWRVWFPPRKGYLLLPKEEQIG